MRTLGITGGIGAGKSTVGELLKELGVATIDTDEVAREVVEPGRPALEEIKTTFGEDLLDAVGGLRRDRMSEIVFQDPQARARLEDILHPRIHAIWRAEVDRWWNSGLAVGAVIIPLLFEKDLADHFQQTICVACSPETQRRRLADRGWNEQAIHNRLESQLPMRRKMELSHYVLWNEGPIRVVRGQLCCLLGLIPGSPRRND